MQVELDGVTVESRVPELAAGLVLARGCRVAPAPAELAEALGAAIGAAKGRSDTEPQTRAVRELLRHGKYKPTGRGKPASEYLLNAAREDRFPRINNLVDINNLVSLAHLLPISLVDLDRARAVSFVLRRGRAEESYVFNAAGQTIALEDLLLLARLPEDLPCANPVKDSLATKLDDAARDVLGVIYAPASAARELAAATEAFTRALERWSGASRVVARSTGVG